MKLRDFMIHTQDFDLDAELIVDEFTVPGRSRGTVKRVAATEGAIVLFFEPKMLDEPVIPDMRETGDLPEVKEGPETDSSEGPL